MASIRTRLRSPVAGFAGNATPAAVPATMGCTSTASRLRLGSGGLARRIPSSALARAATRLPQHIWIAIKRRSKSSPTSTDSSLRAIPRSAQCTSSIRIATGSRLHARSISSRAASNIRVRSSRVSPSETGFGTRRPSKSRTKSDRPSTNAASATRGRNASTIGANERSFAAAPRRPPGCENLSPLPTANPPRPGATYRCRPLRRVPQPAPIPLLPVGSPHRGRPAQRHVQPTVQMQQCPRRLPQLRREPSCDVAHPTEPFANRS